MVIGWRPVGVFGHGLPNLGPVLQVIVGPYVDHLVQRPELRVPAPVSFEYFSLWGNASAKLSSNSATEATVKVSELLTYVLHKSAGFWLWTTNWRRRFVPGKQLPSWLSWSHRIVIALVRCADD